MNGDTNNSLLEVNIRINQFVNYTYTTVKAKLYTGLIHIVIPLHLYKPRCLYRFQFSYT